MESVNNIWINSLWLKITDTSRNETWNLQKQTVEMRSNWRTLAEKEKYFQQLIIYFIVSTFKRYWIADPWGKINKTNIGHRCKTLLKCLLASSETLEKWWGNMSCPRIDSSCQIGAEWRKVEKYDMQTREYMVLICSLQYGQINYGHNIERLLAIIAEDHLVILCINSPTYSFCLQTNLFSKRVIYFLFTVKGCT